MKTKTICDTIKVLIKYSLNGQIISIIRRISVFGERVICLGEHKILSADNKNKKDKKRNVLIYTIITMVSVVVFAAIAFLVVYLTGMKEKEYFENEVSSFAATVDQHVAPKTEPTEKPTAEPTEKPTKAVKETKPKEEEKSSSLYTVTLYPPTYVYAGPSYNYEYTRIIEQEGKYAIAEEFYDASTGLKWGKLESGGGWINLAYANKKLQPYETRGFEPYIVLTYAYTDVYSGPGYDYEWVMTIEQEGTYTIVEDKYNSSTQSSWGKLKSGVGWIDLGNTRR